MRARFHDATTSLDVTVSPSSTNLAKARLMLYPSHEDTFSYAVLESLHLGTPVVGYKIPALEIYYGGLPGVVLVEEWDLEALAVKTMEILEKRVDAVEPPKIKPWGEIMSEEVGLIHKLLEIASLSSWLSNSL